MALTKTTANKKGGTMTKELAKLSVPFGIVLAQKGLLNYLDSQKASTKKSTKTTKTTTKSGGSSCSSGKTTQPKKQPSKGGK